MPIFPPRDFFNSAKPLALVVGDASFIASHLCDELVSRSVKIICLGVSNENTENLISEDFVYGNIEDTDGFLSKIDRVDYVFFLTENRKFSSELALTLVDFSAEKRARFLFGSGLRVKSIEEKNTQEASLKKGLDFRRVHWLDVYGPKMSLSHSSMDQILTAAAGRKTIRIAGNREDFVYPVFIKDVVEGVLKAQVSPGTRGMLFTFAGEKTSVFNFAEYLKNLVGGIETEFVTGEGIKEEMVSDELLNSGRKLIGWEAKKPLEEGIRQTLSWFDRHLPKIKTPVQSVDESTVPIRPTPKPVASFWNGPPKKKRGTRWIAMPFFGLTVLFWIFALPVLQLGLGIVQLGFAERALKSGEVKISTEWFERSLFWFELAAKTFPSWGTLPGLKNEAQGLSKKSYNLNQFARLGVKTTSLIEQVGVLRNGVLGKETFAFEEVLANTQTDTGTLARESGFLAAEMQGADLSFTLPFYGTKTVVFYKELDERRINLALYQELLPVLPELLGMNGKRTYLVLLQDNTELTPGGGKIHSFGLVTFDKGRIINLEVMGSDVADSQLKGQIDPPEPLKKYANLTDWNLSSSGWSSDFPTSASRASWFIEKELEQKVDGVAAYDLEFVKALLADGSEIELESGEGISRDNIYQTSEKSNEDYYAKLNREVLRLLTNSSELKILELAGLSKNTTQKHLAFWTTTSRVKTILAEHGWDGGIRNVSCDSAQKYGDCATDYLQIVDANLGKNKNSRFLEKSYALEVDIKDNFLSHRLTISLENKSPQVYKSYLRLMVPATAKLNLSAVVNPEDGLQENITPDIGSDKGKRSFGTMVEIPAGQKRQIVYLWDVLRNNSAVGSEEGELVFLWQKQMGTFAEPVVLRINLPNPSLKVGAYPVPSLTENGTIGYNTTLSQDLVTNLIWQPK
ncbi:MAG: hypothetical protein A3F61_01560 [Candidatus Blackburnbacteria bacterium RIFCSPHIGHO2_12_FULL_41_13b]|uniref:NAD-dependent epimerase/dehydratase domain-containing protein n=1 Tax=Candidatus Blackburnbacteria bacterium RIFCSPHIGHO2_12_FULL_41_13b TaxID=1797517 RepID=A0A1G1VBZ6_9BACT|nr:MAG: hypothetical protein A3F61_01560 [Candidatus Blackburnbacteria bacterium RIFCSPHIGHO2_12_FULL_41_13b]